jgi:hypothetical protein
LPLYRTRSLRLLGCIVFFELSCAL